MTAHARTSLALFFLIALFGLCGCSRAASPASPSSQGGTAGVLSSGQPIGLEGVVSSLSLDTRTFTIAWRGGTRVVLADASTAVWSQATNSPVRFSALQNGQTVAVRGTDHTRYVLARSIVIVR
jgi:hypothetical protein